MGVLVCPSHPCDMAKDTKNTIFKDIKHEAEDLKKGLGDSKTWLSLFWEGVSTFLWLIVATSAGNGSWAWGLSYVVISLVFAGNKMNSLCVFKQFVYGETSIVHFALTFVAHALGAIAAYTLGPKVGFAAVQVPDHGLAFAGFDWKTFLFGREFWGLFLFCLFREKKFDGEGGFPVSLWNVLILAVAFQIGGANFVFVPSRLFTGFASFADVSVWACFVAQIWAIVAAAVVGDYVWKKYWKN